MEAFPDANDVAQQWASETLVAKNGLVFCTEDMIDMMDMMDMAYGSHMDPIWISYGSHMDLIWIHGLRNALASLRHMRHASNVEGSTMKYIRKTMVVSPVTSGKPHLSGQDKTEHKRI